MADKYGVNSYQINVGGGDSAIHVLFELAGPKILSTVLIDGGVDRDANLNIKSPYSQILRTLDNVQLDLNPGVSAAYEQLKLDAIVITHWDSDHVMGVIDLIGSYCTDKAPDPKYRGVDILKYDPTTKDPLTVLYVPYWEKASSNMTSLKAKSNHPKNDADTFKGRLFKDATETLTYRIAEIDPKTGKQVVDPKTGPKWKEYGNLCKIKYTPAAMLGVDFFTHSPPVANPSTVMSFEAFLGLVDATRPGLFCIATDRRRLGSNETEDSTLPDPPVGRAAPVPGDGDGATLKIPDQLRIAGVPKTTANNKPSVINMLIWPDTKRIAFYTAGDIDEYYEDLIVKWTKDSADNYPKVRALKVSHHGASGSFPPSVMDRWKPQALILSSGVHYRHPSWAIYYYISLMEPPVGKILWSTCYPYYLRKANEKDTTPTDPDKWAAELTQISEQKKFFTQFESAFYKLVLDKRYKALEDPKQEGPLYERYYDTYTTWDPTVPGRTRELLSRMVTRFDTLSHTTRSAAPFSGDHDYFGTTSTHGTKIWYIKNVSRRTESAEKTLAVCNNGTTIVTADLTPIAPVRATKRAADGGTTSGPTPTKVPALAAPIAGPSPGSSSGSASYPSFGMNDGAGDDDAVDGDLYQSLSVPQAAEPKPFVPFYTATEGAGVFFFAKDIPSPPGKYHVVTNDEEKLFISWLHRRVIGLTAEFPADAAGSSDFLADDEVLVWMKSAFGTSTTLSVKGKAASIQCFDLSIALTTTSTATLEFSTEAIPLQFDLAEGAATVIPFILGWGVFKQFPIMIFGLKSGYETTVGELWKLAGFTTSPPINVKLQIASSLSDDAKTHFKRNAVFFSPLEDYKTLLRLQFEVTELDDIKNLFKELFSEKFVFKEADFTLRKTFVHRWSSEGTASVYAQGEILMRAAASIGSLDFSFTFLLSDTVHQAILDFTAGADLWTAVEWMGELFGADLGFKSWLPEDLLKDIKLSRIVLSFQPGEKIKLISGCVTFEVDLAFGAENDGERVVILLSYSWPPSRLSGSLWPEYIRKDPNFILYPEWEEHVRLEPKTGPDVTVSKGLYLSKLIPGETIHIPEHVLPVVLSADVALDKDSIYFGGLLAWETSSELPIVSMRDVMLTAYYNWKVKQMNLSIFLRANLNPRDETLPSADLFGALQYNNGSWALTCEVRDLYFSTLASFFDADISDGVMDMIEQMRIKQLLVQYQYNNTGRASNFLLSGSVELGPLLAELSYSHKPGEWTFSIGVKPSDQEATIGQLLESITGDDVDLPSFVGDIALVQSNTQDVFSIAITKQTAAGTGNTHLVFYGKFQISAFAFSYLQIKNTSVANAETKRIIRLGVATLPQSDIPLVGMIPQPFDEMSFYWVDTNADGVTREEVDIINTTLGAAERGSHINFKDPQPNNPQKTDIVLRRGLHLLIAETIGGVSKVILDHCFGSTRKQNSSAAFDSSGAVVAAGSENTGKGEATTAPLAKKFGALRISNVGLQFINNTLYVVLDATFDLGPMSMALLGFGIGIDFSKGFTLKNMPTSPTDLEVKLEGLAVGFERPPVTMAGEFRYRNQLYSGGITVGFTPYLFLAAGFYGEVARSSGSGKYKTVFVFCKLNGPLVTLAFAEISGICGGFGYNNFITFPTVAQVPTFPFIGSNMGNVSPTEALASLTGPSGWVQPREDVFWLAAGMSVTAFRMLSFDAVVVLEFNPYVKLGLFALAQASLPPKKSGISFLFVELGITAVVDWESGTMKVEGQLTPNSYVLAPSCHLTGGFALFYWFGDSEYSGDWVFTVGGYHPSYTKPAHFPAPPRLGIKWSIDSNLTVTGESYFAITPKCCMAGGRLHAALSLGPLGAWFDAQANFLINYNPFSFMGDAGVSVGVSFTLDLWICTIRISVEIGAHLYLAGPPFGGRVHVNFWVMGFDIEFGRKQQSQPAVDLDAFWQMVLQDEVSSIRSSRAEKRRVLAGLPAANPVPTAASQGDHLLTPETGLLPTSSKDAETWDVRGGVFSFRVQSRFALNDVTCYSDPDEEQVAYTKNSAAIYAKPMHLTSALTSNMKVSIHKNNAEVMLLSETDATDHWQMSQVVKNVPVALWGQYDATQDPTSGKNNLSSLLSSRDNTVSLMMGVTIVSPKPTISSDKIPKFNFVHAFAVDVYGPAEQKPKFPVIAKSAETFFPEKPDSGPKQWDDVKNAWAAPAAATAAKSVLDAWKAAFGWSSEAKVQSTPPPKVLSEFGQLYMSAPLLCGAV